MSTAQLELRWETLRGVVPVTATCSREHAAPWQIRRDGFIERQDGARKAEERHRRREDAKPLTPFWGGPAAEACPWQFSTALGVLQAPSKSLKP